MCAFNHSYSIRERTECTRKTRYALGTQRRMGRRGHDPLGHLPRWAARLEKETFLVANPIKYYK